MPAFFVGVKNIGFADQGFRLATPKINMRVLLNPFKSLCFKSLAHFLFGILKHVPWAHWHPCHFSNESLRSTHFFSTAKKSRQKRPLEGNALHPVIL